MLTYALTKTSSWLGVTKESRGTSNKKGLQNSSSWSLCTRNLHRATPSYPRDQGPLWEGSSSSVSKDTPHHFLLTPGIRVLFGKEVVLQLVKILPIIFWNQMVHRHIHSSPPHWPLSSARWIQSMPSNSVSLPSTLIPFSHLCLALGSDLFPSVFLTKTLCARSSSPLCLSMFVTWM